MQFTTSVTQKGQATIPYPIRKKLGIQPNTKIVFELNDKNEAKILPVANFFSLKGSIKSKKRFDIERMDQAVGKYLSDEYKEKSNRY